MERRSPERCFVSKLFQHRSLVTLGDLGWARLIGADGKAVMDCKMTLKGGGGAMEWNTLELRKGGPVTVFSSLNFYRSRDEDEEAE